VLAAVHLLLALPLFVIVVAADPRWLQAAITDYRRRLFTAGSGSPAEAENGPLARPATGTTLDYLDKLFQIPFGLLPMSDGDVWERYLGSLLLPALDPAPPAGGPAGQRRATGGAGQGGTDHGGGGRSGDDARDELAALRISPAEAAFLPKLHPLIPTPRAGKKLVNLYRLLRIGVPETDLPSFIGNASGDGDYQVVALLLAVLVHDEDEAHRLFHALDHFDGDTDIINELRADHPTPSPGHAATSVAEWTDLKTLRDELVDLVRSLIAPGSFSRETGRYQAWLGQVRRFSFYNLQA
jgi:hypothetical protein